MDEPTSTVLQKYVLEKNGREPGTRFRPSRFLHGRNEPPPPQRLQTDEPASSVIASSFHQPPRTRVPRRCTGAARAAHPVRSGSSAPKLHEGRAGVDSLWDVTQPTAEIRSGFPRPLPSCLHGIEEICGSSVPTDRPRRSLRSIAGRFRRRLEGSRIIDRQRQMDARFLRLSSPNARGR